MNSLDGMVSPQKRIAQNRWMLKGRVTCAIAQLNNLRIVGTTTSEERQKLSKAIEQLSLILDVFSKSNQELGLKK